MKLVLSKKEKEYFKNMDSETRSTALFLLKSGMLMDIIQKLKDKGELK